MFKLANQASRRLSVIIVLATTAVVLGSALALAATPLPPTPERSIPPIVQKWAAAWNNADARGMAALFTADGIYRDNAFQAQFQGQAGIESWVTITVESIPNAHAEILGALQTGDRAAVWWTFTGTPAASNPLQIGGESFSVPVASIFELKGDRIGRVTDYYNLADVLRQLGLPSGPWVPPNP